MTAVGLAAFGARAAPAVPEADAAASSRPAGDGRAFFVADFTREAARLRALRRRPEAVSPLFALLALRDSVPDEGIEPVLREVADASDSDPLVAAQASYLLARIRDDRGDGAEAERRRVGLGLLTRFWVVGPFGEGRSSFEQAFPPEAERAEPGAPDPARRYPGKEREVGWRKATDAVRQGALYLDALLRPDSQGVAYALAFVRAEKPVPAAVLRMGSPGPIKVWVNGAPVHSRDAVRAAWLDQDAAPIALRQGWNRILIKSVITDGPWRLLARITDAAGRALPVATAEAPDPSPAATGRPAAPARAAAARPPLRKMEALLRARAEQAEHARRPARPGAAPATADAADAWLDLGRYLAWSQPGDREAREDVAALERSIAARPTVAALLMLADVARDEDERRRALERALAIAPPAGAERAQVLVRLGDVAREQHRDAVALARWREALAADAGCWPAALALAEEEQGAGLPFLALGRLQALPDAVRALVKVRQQEARLYSALDRHAEEERALGAIAGVRGQSVELLHELARRARARGDADAAIDRLRSAAALRPDLPSLAIELSRSLEGAGQRDAARAALEATVARIPDDPGSRAQLGKLLHRLGQNDAALGHLRAAIALRPQDPELRRYTERVAAARDGADPLAGDDLARRYAADVLAGLKKGPWEGPVDPPRTSAAGQSPSALTRPLKERAPAAAVDPAVVLLDRRVVRVHRNGLAQTFAQRVVEVRTDRGAEDNKQFYVRYTPGVEEVEIRQARIFRRAPGPGGEVQILEASDRDDEDLSEPWYGLYYDNRAEVVRFEGLRAGDVLEVQYLVDDVSTENQLADYFGDLQFIGESIPKRRWDYTLIGPADRVFYTNTPRLPGLEQEVTPAEAAEAEKAGERVRRFAARDVAKIESEPAMPGYTEVAPYLHVSTYASWRDVGAWYWRLVSEQMVPDDALRKAARSVLRAGMTDEEKVRAIHGLVVSGTRYVGLEFGIHGFKPYKVTQVLARRFGDCKDKATLMIALLREAGIDAELVLLRTRRGGRIDPEPASLAVFDHAIAYVPKLGVYLDGTAEFSGTRELPSQDQGVTVLRVGPNGTVLAETPVMASSENRAQRRWDVVLQPGGEARITETLTITGQAAPEWREHYQTPGERLERYSKVWTGRYPGATLLAVDMPGIEDRNLPVTVQATATVPKIGQAGQKGRESGELDLPVTVRDADFSRTYARLSERKEDLLIAYPWQHEEELTFHLPEGWQIESVPAGRASEAPFGRFRLEVSSAGGGREVHVHSFLDVSQHRIPPADYARFRQFLGEIDAALAARITIRKSAP